MDQSSSSEGTLSHLFKNSPPFMGHEDSQGPSTGSYPEPDESSSYPHTRLLSDFNIIPSCTPRILKWFFPSGFPTKILYALFFPHAYYMARSSRPLWICHARLMFGEECKLWTFWLCSFVQSLGPDFLITLFSMTLIMRFRWVLLENIKHEDGR
jgi:hypothetical protein